MVNLRNADQPMSLDRPTILILSSDPAFARELAENWPSEPTPPEFTVLEEGLFNDLAGEHYDLAIADGSKPDSRSSLRQALKLAGKPAIVIHSDCSSAFSQSEGSVIELRRDITLDSASDAQNWAAIVALVGREMLQRSIAEIRQRNAERIRAAVEAEAVLGRYMIEMRHNVNNALTSVLGNAELLALEPGLPANVAAQADTVRNMALRLHEVFQRFSSIEKELSVAARESSKRLPARGAAGGRQG